MTTYYLVRHGIKVSQAEDTSLSELGIKQAELTAGFLSNLNISAIYSSPLKRTQQTAKIISDYLKTPVKTDDRLKERMVFDEKWGISYEEYLVEWNKATFDRFYKSSCGDSSFVSGNRLKSVLDEISNDKANVIVTHGGIIGDFLRNVFPNNLLKFCSDPKSSLKWIEILECSITEVSKNSDVYRFKRINDVSHLNR